MITYVINFIMCSGLLLLIYRAFLGNENLYRFNRFYLLFSLVFSLAVPFITIGIQHIKVPIPDQRIISQKVAAVINSPVYRPTINRSIINNTVHRTNTNKPAIDGTVHQATGNQPVPSITSSLVQRHILQTPKHNYFPGLLLAIYSIITLLMLFRFVRNGYKISRLITKNAIIPYQDTKLILLDEEVTPHSFLKYVFINKSDYKNGLIEPEIICHEQTHVKQRHSLDIIVVELLQTICWFNPFIPFYRKTIQLNHEFLADEAVVKNYDDTPAYQYLLLSKASQRGSLYLSSQFNYSATKKRLMMMTKSTSAKIALYKKLAMAPLIVYALLLFCNKGIAQTTRAAVKSAYKNMAVAINKISLATDPAPENPIANGPMATENAADSTNTQSRVMVSAPLTTQNGDNVTNLQNQAAITDTLTVKLPNVQQVSLRAPANIKIDGKATEWNNRFQAYNDSAHVYYTIANDDKNLYLTVQATDPAIIRLIMAEGVGLTIDKAGKRDKLNNDAPNFSYPTRENANGTYGYPVHINVGDAKLPPDSIARAFNKQLAADSKYVRVINLDRIAELTPINNRDGIKVASLFDNKMVYTYELAVDLSVLGLDTAKPGKFAYNIAVGEGHLIEDLMRKYTVNGASFIGAAHYFASPSPDNPHGYVPADFWGEYTLATK